MHPSEQAARFDRMPRGWTLAIIDKQRKSGLRSVLIHGLPPITGGANYALVCALLAKYAADRQAGRAPESYGYTAAPSLAAELSVDEATLRRRVSRLRRTVAHMCVEHLGFPLAQDALIESKSWQGYRINPAVRVVASTEIKVARHSFPS